ncbi:MAG: HlyD family type I secretion periplasmic adaptor subunit [Mesorhizobium sp.]|nr:HlyD family type I secretion periplasmic adaptor subunit [Mesorhizobium sp.]MBL8575749.1 HlyD family type I secretion periplasmic adaptor subunit [Mesorhizobium sp.]
MADVDLNFANDPRAVIESSVTPGAWRLLIVIATVFVLFVLWASVARIDQMASGVGRVIPSSQVQVVQSLEPGIVAEILVSEGDRVESGQNLVRIDDTGVASKLGELRQQQLALAAELDRLNAQASGAKEYGPPPTRQPDAEPYYRDQQAIFLADRRKLAETILIRQQQLVQRRQNLLEAEATAAKQADALKLAERELELTRALFERKAVPELEFLRIQRDVAELRGGLEIWKAQKLRLEAEVAEAEAQIEAETSAFLAEVQARISKVNAEMSVVNESLRAADDRVRRAMLKSPVAGVVNALNVVTIGEVIAAGANVAEVVPVDDTLLVETRVRPQDVAFIHPGADATVRLSAYDYTKFGTLKGRVERISADTITDESGETFYQVIVSTDTTDGELPQEMRVIPGMVATVDISNGERTVLEYLLKPVLKIRDQALREAR